MAIEPWRVDRLLLDDENFRLPPELRGANQEQLLQHFAEHYDIEELGLSMARKGYFEEEPLLTVSAADADYRIVVEGNRRLAALKLLTQSDARALVTDEIWAELAGQVTERGLALEEVPTRNYDSREQLLDYLGFRHVSGLMPWTPEAKARYVHALVVDHGYTFQDAARAIGSRADAIRRQFIAFRSLQQSKDAGVDVSEAEHRFGVFYRSLQNPGIRTFLTLSGWTDGTPDTHEPLAVDGPQRMAEYLSWVFERPRVVRDSRQLDDLGKVVTDETALGMLREHRDLQLALQELPPDRQAVFSAIRSAYRELARAHGLAYQFAGDEELIAEVSRVEPLVDRLKESLSPPHHEAQGAVDTES